MKGPNKEGIPLKSHENFGVPPILHLKQHFTRSALTVSFLPVISPLCTILSFSYRGYPRNMLGL